MADLISRQEVIIALRESGLCYNNWLEVLGVIDAVPNAKEHIKNGDLISRQDALIEARPEFLNPQQQSERVLYNQGWNDAITGYYDNIKSLPSAETSQNLAKPNKELECSDIISREDAIVAVKNALRKEDDWFQEAIASRIELLPSADRPTEWIPCSERMPYAEYGEGDSVLCCTETGLMYILYWNGGNWCDPTGEPHIWVNHKTGWHDRVIAWLPLPTPYKGGEE